MNERIVAFILIICFAPLFLLIYFFCVIFDEKPCIYRSERLGKNKEKFLMYKFATMKNWAPHEFEQHLKENKPLQNEWAKFRKLYSDPRCSKYGKFLRRFSLDELPQLFNVFYGDMALVGPRPIAESEDALYGKYSNLLHSVKPGMTGLWQVSGRNLTTYRRRIAMDIYYVKHKSLKLDLYIIIKTFRAVVGGKGAY